MREQQLDFVMLWDMFMLSDEWRFHDILEYKTFATPPVAIVMVNQVHW